MSLLTCPICKKNLINTGKTYRCAAGHSYDIASAGYVNLLPANKKHSKEPGDDKEMSAARHAFLSKGYYSPLRDALCSLALCYTPCSSAVLDAGCGEGYYTSAIYDALSSSGRNVRMVGIDISKFILKTAAKRSQNIEYAVASSYNIPLPDTSADLIINCFSPLALGEFLRILKPNGTFIYVVPAKEHLFELKQVLYDSPYENEEKETPYEGFSYEKIVPVKTSFTLKDKTDIENLFKMTPYYWKTPKEGAKRLNDLNSLDVTASFNIHVFKKEDKV